jgi:4-hydroxybenzoyl-CoA reductase subunit beta
MLRLPAFSYHAPTSVAEAVALLSDGKAKILAGGTDLLPNMKHEIETPERLVSLRNLGLAGIREDQDHYVVGAMTALQTVAEDLGAHLPGLGEAVRAIAGPMHRRMGTLGGNICLDTRCVYINQSYFWRNALGYCLKKDGTLCHVVAKGRRCVAAASNDAALPLLLYGATLVLVGAAGERRVRLVDFYTADGIHNKVLQREILTEICIPKPAEGTAVTFEKLRLRRSIDFPLLNVAALTAPGRLELCIGALGARPKHLPLNALAEDVDRIDKAARRAYESARPLTNLATDPEWRRHMVTVLVRRALSRHAAYTASATSKT